MKKMNKKGAISMRLVKIILMALVVIIVISASVYYYNHGAIPGLTNLGTAR